MESLTLLAGRLGGRIDGTAGRVLLKFGNNNIEFISRKGIHNIHKYGLGLAQV